MNIRQQLVLKILKFMDTHAYEAQTAAGIIDIVMSAEQNQPVYSKTQVASTFGNDKEYATFKQALLNWFDYHLFYNSMGEFRRLLKRYVDKPFKIAQTPYDRHRLI